MTPNPYQQQQVATANPAQLVLMLYDRVLTAIDRVQDVEIPLTSTDIELVNHELQRAQEILEELQLTLDHDKGGPVAASLEGLYNFCINLLVQANVKKDFSHLAEVTRIVTDLRDAWEEACCKAVASVG